MESIEINAKISNYENACKEAALLCGAPTATTNQHDTFYKVNVGQLKMRKYDDSTVMLVRYDPVGEVTPSTSNDGLMHFNESNYLQSVLLNGILDKCVGTRGTVKKERKLFMIENELRIHVDRVENLGDFVKIKVILKSGQTPEDGQGVVDQLIEKFEIKKEDQFTCSYIEMIEKKK